MPAWFTSETKWEKYYRVGPNRPVYLGQDYSFRINIFFNLYLDTKLTFYLQNDATTMCH